ncbi:NAD(P)-dependent alcohol dehydrogenase [Prosthecodimorpha staleyi]|uniref:NAD(P)-dependent alcohol dehydrogenase n=1 Tax=Prosthecodimorpha staleyi TaxID=2840188 RepID=A0A947D4I8_9HYPH|nr:NAD(P)-dependent alcohol dehydrogenase [Prosthecodimorpha staleyi]MBT9290198.1 NAD(P)-dependent alcohol dehydrogenase [Prosthecodimorpha staleyi]
MFEARAAIFGEAGESVRIEPVRLEAPRADEVLVRIVATGLCHTDILARDGRLPYRRPAVFGHEGSGIVEAVGAAVAGFAPGDPVVVTYRSCGTCPNCLDARSAYCEDKRRLNFSGGRADGTSPVFRCDGTAVAAAFFGQSSFAERVVVAARALVKLPADVPVELMGPLGCGFQTGAGAILNVLKPAPGSALAVIGAGAVGLAAVMAAKAAGAYPILAVDRDAGRLDLALDLGASHAVTAGAGALDEIRAIAGRGGVDGAVECVGSAATVRLALEALRMGGTAAVTGAAAGTGDIAIPAATLLYGRTLRGVIQGDSNPPVFIPRLIELWRQGRFPFDRLVRFFPFDEIEAAFAAAASGQVVKPILRMADP